ncbi:hypothetical protein L3X38_033101 [Prunus dulcis]|uniref:Uncharacterized protein n=1 Tax=Prunus dulcis TaxID=3755 RepID=A0AAD4VGG0_PRUDU|nr:hypothetical protein L3X38_033101 [Prunus dulcis]
MLLIRAGLGMPVPDWTVSNFNCQVSAVNRTNVRVWQSFNLFQALECFLDMTELLPLQSEGGRSGWIQGLLSWNCTMMPVLLDQGSL